ADRGVLGQKLVLNGHPFIIIGVLPYGFRDDEVTYSLNYAFTIPITNLPVLTRKANALRTRGDWTTCRAIGRLRPGVNEEAARREAQDLLRSAYLQDPPSGSPANLPDSEPRLISVGRSWGLGGLWALFRMITQGGNLDTDFLLLLMML